MPLDVVCQAAHAGSQVIAAAATAAVSFAAADDIDYQGVHVPGTTPTRFTAPLPGTYEIDAQLALVAAGAGTFTLKTQVDGSGGVATGAYVTSAVSSAYGYRNCVVLNAGQYVELVMTVAANDVTIASGSRLIFKRLTQQGQ